MKHSLILTLALALSLALTSCPNTSTAPVPESETGKDIPATISPEIIVMVNLNYYSKDTFIDLVDSDIDRVDLAVWYDGGSLIINGPPYTPDEPMEYRIPNSFPSEVTEIGITLLAHHRLITNINNQDFGGTYWALIPKLDCQINGLYNHEAEDENGNPLGYFDIPIADYNNLGQSMYLTIDSNNALIIPQNGQYIEKGATMTDRNEGDISDRVVISGTVNPTVVSTYYVQYTGSNSLGIAAYPAIRTVKVIAPPSPSSIYFSYSRRYPAGRIRVKVDLDPAVAKLAFWGLPSASQIDRLEIWRYYEGVPTPPWQTTEGASYLIGRPLEFDIVPGRTKAVKVNIIAKSPSGQVYYGNPDYLVAYYNNTIILPDPSGTWDFTVK